MQSNLAFAFTTPPLKSEPTPPPASWIQCDLFLNRANPLLHMENGIPWDTIRSEDFMPALKTILAESSIEFEKIITQTEPATFENTVQRFEDITNRIDGVGALYWHYWNSLKDDTILKIETIFSNTYFDWYIDAFSNPKLAERINQVLAQLKLDAKVARTSAIASRIEEEIASISHWTPYLISVEGEDLKQYRDYLAESARLSQQFYTNYRIIEESTRLIVHSEAELVGLSDYSIAKVKKLGFDKNTWVIPMTDHALIEEVMQNAPEPLRKKAFFALYPKETSQKYLTAEEAGAAWSVSNRDIIRRLNEIDRATASSYAGRPSYAHWAIHFSVAKTPDKVRTFLDTIAPYVLKKAKKEIDTIESYARASDPNFKVLNRWDVQFYMARWMEHQFGQELLDLKEYFEVNNVIDGHFDFLSKMFGIKFKEIKGAPSADSSVRVFEVYNKKGKQPLAILYLDLYSRKNKENWAWCQALRLRHQTKSGLKIPIMNVASNITPMLNGQPSFLRLWDLFAFTHETGHALGEVLSDVIHSNLSTFMSSADWVEFPSQIIEYLPYRPDYLKAVAKHYKTGAKMTESMMKTFKEVNLADMGLEKLRVLRMSYLDLAYNEQGITNAETIEEFEQRVVGGLKLFPDVEARELSDNFKHSFAFGYASVFYGYPYSDMLAKLANLQIGDDPKDLVEQAAGLREIFAYGIMRPPEKLVKLFSGVDYDPEHWLKFYGFK